MVLNTYLPFNAQSVPMMLYAGGQKSMPLVRVFCARAQDCKIKFQSCSLFFFRVANTSWCAFRNPSGPGSPSNSGGSCEMFACDVELCSEDWMDAGTPATVCM